MHLQRFALICLTLLTVLCALPLNASATSGLPNVATFGYGARVDIWGQDVISSIALASDLGLDWLAIDVDWNRHWPSLQNTANFSPLDVALQAARYEQISVLLTLINPPPWALTSTGPDVAITLAVLQAIVNPYTDVIQAVELFPGANTAAQWGAAANPSAYLGLLQSVRQGFDANGYSIYLVTSVEPLQEPSTQGNLDDLTFLENLYTLGGAAYMPIVGLRFPTVIGAPMADPDKTNHFALRHYENIRQVMLSHQHETGLIWITGFSWPTSGLADLAEPLSLPATPALQAQWTNEALQLLRAQLYIGAGFFSNLNPNAANPNLPALLNIGGGIHPACVPISQYAGGIITSTSWTPPLAGLTPTVAQAAAPKYIHYPEKPRK